MCVSILSHNVSDSGGDWIMLIDSIYIYFLFILTVIQETSHKIKKKNIAPSIKQQYQHWQKKENTHTQVLSILFRLNSVVKLRKSVSNLMKLCYMNVFKLLSNWFIPVSKANNVIYFCRKWILSSSLTYRNRLALNGWN